MQLFECFTFEYISFSTGPAPKAHGYMRSPVRSWLTYGLVRSTGLVWRSEPVHLGEVVWTNIIQRFTYKGVN